MIDSDFKVKVFDLAVMVISIGHFSQGNSLVSKSKECLRTTTTLELYLIILLVG